MKLSYTIPNNTKIGHVHLKVADLQRALDFYCGLLGFELVTQWKDSAAFISAGGYHHHISSPAPYIPSPVVFPNAHSSPALSPSV